MTNMIYSVFIAALVITNCVLQHKDNSLRSVTQQNTGNDTARTELNYIFESGTNGYEVFRIPAIIKTGYGTLLAFAEARKNGGSDNGDIDMVLKRSLDNGKTWSDLITVWDDDENTCGNPVPIVDQKTGKIFLLMTWNFAEDNRVKIVKGISKNTRRVFVTYSEDDGLTWADPKEITSSVKLRDWGWYATGPCHGIQISTGPYKGRLVVPCDYIEKYTNKYGSHIIYSDDHGKTWELGGIVSSSDHINVNESTVAELPTGGLILNMRSGSKRRMIAKSTDGGLTWSKAVQDSQLLDPNCQGSLLAFRRNNDYLLFFSNPASGERRKRVNMTIQLSENNGDSWKGSYQVYEGPSAYSDLVKISDNSIGIVYEGGYSIPYEGIVFESIPIYRIK